MRGTGRTTKQLMNAPENSVFVWCNDDISYPLRLARNMCRDDIEVKPLCWFKENNICGRRMQICFDHAVILTHKQEELYKYLLTRSLVCGIT
jgi:hypothetical protein